MFVSRREKSAIFKRTLAGFRNLPPDQLYQKLRGRLGLSNIHIILSVHFFFLHIWYKSLKTWWNTFIDSDIANIQIHTQTRIAAAIAVHIHKKRKWLVWMSVRLMSSCSCYDWARSKPASVLVDGVTAASTTLLHHSCSFSKSVLCGEFGKTSDFELVMVGYQVKISGFSRRLCLSSFLRSDFIPLSVRLGCCGGGVTLRSQVPVPL